MKSTKIETRSCFSSCTEIAKFCEGFLHCQTTPLFEVHAVCRHTIRAGSEPLRAFASYKKSLWWTITRPLVCVIRLTTPKLMYCYHTTIESSLELPQYSGVTAAMLNMHTVSLAIYMYSSRLLMHQCLFIGNRLLNARYCRSYLNLVYYQTLCI